MSIVVEPAWDDRASVWRLDIWDGDAEPAYLPGAAATGPKHRLWPIVAAAATVMRGATSDHKGMKWDPETTSKGDMRTIADAAQKAVTKVQS